VARVTATDRRPLDLVHPKLSVDVRDLTAQGADDLLASATVAIHLAFHVDRRPGQDVTALNDHAARRFIEAAAARMDALILASSIAAYGLSETAVDRLSEDAPIAPGRGFYYAEQKIAMERLLATLTPSTRARLVIARPAQVGGPTIDPRRALQFKDRLLILPRVAHALRFQALHEADLGPAFAALLEAPSGVYNLAPDDVLEMDEVARVTGQRLVHAPRWVCRALCDLTWRLGLNSLDAEWLRMQDYPTLVADNAKLRALGWRPTKTTADALLDTVAALRGIPMEATT
jgi:nucleoside-diphosphate-sugar epimerase